jgi:alpha-galactosidase
LGRQGRKVRDDGDLEVWSKELSDGSRAVLLFHRSDDVASIAFNWNEIGLPQNLQFSVRDLWEKDEKGKFKETYQAYVASHGVVMVKVY